MPRRQHLPDDLTPGQVVALQDALLSNADRLLQAAVAMLEGDSAPLARSLAILGMEESGKAIALHERRVRMAYAPEGERSEEHTSELQSRGHLVSRRLHEHT